MDSGKDKCQGIESWTFSGIVASFLDLAIAYLLLCVSAIAYIASRFLGFFGLSLPCPCNGLFGNPNPLLLNSPSDRSKLPYGSTSMNRNSEFNVKSFRGRSWENAQAELEGEASCSSAAERKKEKRYACRCSRKNEMGIELCASNSPALKKGRVDGKGKGAISLRSALRRRWRRQTAADYGVLSSSDDASYDLSGFDKTEGSLEPVNSVASDGSEAPEGNSLQETLTNDSESSEAVDEIKSKEHDFFTAEEFKYNEHKDMGNDENVISLLEQALAEEHAVRATLYSELEKERIAAATAADEAMNMILRLQEDKAAVEMEARHYQRIIEAKSTYDTEEMNILKEILLRREHEKHFLEKEVEAYQKMFIGYEQLDADTSGYLAMQGKDPLLMLEGAKSNVDFANSSTDYGVTYIESKDHTFDEHDNSEVPTASGKASPFGMRRSSMSTLELKSRDEAEKGVSKSNTDLTSGLCPSRSNLGLRRSSMSALDNERLKLEAELGWLREKLKIVRKGKEKLNISVELKDQDKVVFNLLDDVTNQLQEIQQLTGPGNAAPDTILPPQPSSSKVTSKKRRSLEVPES